MSQQSVFFTNQQLINILKHHYNLIVIKIAPLTGYDDLNFLIATDQPNKYVFKFASLTKTLSLIQAEVQALNFINQNKIQYQEILVSFPKVVRTQSGTQIINLKLENKLYYGRLLTYIEGILLNQIKLTQKICQSFGLVVAKMDNVLKLFKNQVFQQKKVLWDLANVLQMKKNINYVQTQENKELILYFLGKLQENFIPKLKELPKSIIHNDANLHNIIVNPQTQSIIGVIDFQDMVYTSTIFQIAVVLTYVLHTNINSRKDICTILQSYNKFHPLSKVQISILYYAIAARNCISILNAYYSSSIQPQNKHILISLQSALKTLKLLKNEGYQQFVKIFEQVCQI